MKKISLSPTLLLFFVIFTLGIIFYLPSAVAVNAQQTCNYSGVWDTHNHFWNILTCSQSGSTVHCDSDAVDGHGVPLNATIDGEVGADGNVHGEYYRDEWNFGEVTLNHGDNWLGIITESGGTWGADRIGHCESAPADKCAGDPCDGWPQAECENNVSQTKPDCNPDTGRCDFTDEVPCGEAGCNQDTGRCNELIEDTLDCNAVCSLAICEDGFSYDNTGCDSDNCYFDDHEAEYCDYGCDESTGRCIEDDPNDKYGEPCDPDSCEGDTLWYGGERDGDGVCKYITVECSAGCTDGVCNTVPTLIPGDWDLSIKRMVLVQSVEGGRYVAEKPAAMVVYFDWPDPTTDLDVEVSITIDGTTYQTKTHRVKHTYSNKEKMYVNDAAIFEIPARLLTPGFHTFMVNASLTALQSDQMHIEDPDLTNNFQALTDLSFTPTRSTTLLVQSTHPDIGVGDMWQYLSKARPFLLDTYPFRDVVILDDFIMHRYAKVQNEITWMLQLALKKTLYNSQLPPGKPKAEYSVGLFPLGYWDDGSVNIPALLEPLGSGSWDVEKGTQIRGFTFTGLSKNLMVNSSIHQVLAHEMGHDLVTGLEEYDLNPPFGYKLPKDTLIYWGYGQGQYNSRDPNYDGVELIDNIGLGYVNFMGAGLPYFVNKSTWDLLVDRLSTGHGSVGSRVPGLAAEMPRAEQQDQSGPGYFVAGAIGSDLTVTIDSLVWLENLELISNETTESPFWLEAVSDQLESVAQIPIEVDFSFSDPYPFVATLPGNPATIAGLNLYHQQEIIWWQTPSSGAPQVQIIAPEESAPLSGEASISWTASDPDGDVLTSYLFYSPDDGETWLPIAADLTSSSFSMNADQLPGCNDCRLRVLVSDGWNTTTATTAGTFSVAGKGPSVEIGYPEEGDEIMPGGQVILSAIAFDPEEGLLEGTSISWDSDKDGTLGTGSRLVVPSLSPGNHQIRVSAFDGVGNASAAAVNIMVGTGSETTEDGNINDLYIGFYILCGVIGIALIGVSGFFGYKYFKKGRKKAIPNESE